MKKIFLFTASLVFAMTHSVHANNQTNEMNMSGSAVKIINMYPGSWRGWKDGCVNCDKPLASDNVNTKRVRTKRKKPKSNKSKNIKARRVIPKSVLRGYCECNCNPSTNKESMNNNSHRVFGVKDSSDKDNAARDNNMSINKELTPIKQPNDKSDETDKEKERVKEKDKKKNEGYEEGEGTQSRINEKIIKIFSLWKS